MHACIPMHQLPPWEPAPAARTRLPVVVRRKQWPLPLPLPLPVSTAHLDVGAYLPIMGARPVWLPACVRVTNKQIHTHAMGNCPLRRRTPPLRLATTASLPRSSCWAAPWRRTCATCPPGWCAGRAAPVGGCAVLRYGIWHRRQGGNAPAMGRSARMHLRVWDAPTLPLPHPARAAERERTHHTGQAAPTVVPVRLCLIDASVRHA